MPGFHHILCPVDFSERSKAIRPYVKAFAKRFHAKLTLLNAIEVPPPDVYGIDQSFPVMFDFPTLEPLLRKRLENYFDSAEAAPSEATSEVTRVVQLGDPAVTIADYAREQQVDLIMMPTHGYGRFRSLLLGSVVSKVLHDVDCPVWTAPHVEDPGLLHHLECRSILAAIDFGQADVIRGAAELAREFGASLRLVHAVPGAARTPGETGGDEFRLFLLSSAREEIAKLQSQAGTALDVSVVAGPVGTVARKVALEYDSDLLVIGRGVMHQTFGRLRTESYSLIRESPCPVLSL
jgi:nucleotide-binding universal stress UspA family protein